MPRVAGSGEVFQCLRPLGERLLSSVLLWFGLSSLLCLLCLSSVLLALVGFPLRPSGANRQGAANSLSRKSSRCIFRSSFSMARLSSGLYQKKNMRCFCLSSADVAVKTGLSVYGCTPE